MVKVARKCILVHFGAVLGIKWIAHAWSNVDGRNWSPKESRNLLRRWKKLIQDLEEKESTTKKETWVKLPYFDLVNPNLFLLMFQLSKGFLINLGHLNISSRSLNPSQRGMPHHLTPSPFLTVQGILIPFPIFLAATSYPLSLGILTLILLFLVDLGSNSFLKHWIKV